MPRTVEVLLAGIGLIVVSPLLLVVGAAIAVSDGSPVFYRARRVGRHGKEFILLKFRTMSADADQQGGGLTERNDKRVTRLGMFLRRYKLDELPQLYNVLRGEMSFVGPRPEDPRYVAQYSDQQRGILKYRPGITSPASLSYKDEAGMLSGDGFEKLYIESILPEKLAMDAEYLIDRTFLSDVKLILRTITGIAR